MSIPIAPEFTQMILDFFYEAGTVGQLVKNTSEYDPSTGDTTDTSSSVDLQCIVLDLTLQSNGWANRLGTDIQTGDKVIFSRPPKSVNPLAPNPVIDPQIDRIVVGGVSYAITTFKEVNPTMGSDPLLYEFYVRR